MDGAYDIFKKLSTKDAVWMETVQGNGARNLFYQDFVFGNSFSELSGFFFSRHRGTT